MTPSPSVELLSRAHLIAGLATSRLSELDLTLGEAHLLMLITADGPTAIRDLQISSGHRPSTLGSIVDRLESGALVRRRRSGEDKRVVELALTARGSAARDRVMGVFTEIDGFQGVEW